MEVGEGGSEGGWRQVGVDSNTYYLNKASLQGRRFLGLMPSRKGGGVGVQLSLL